jgi:hypothetical protein
LKKLLAITLLLLVFFNHVTYYFVFTVQQYYIRKEMKKQMLASVPDSTLEKIPHSTKLTWKKHGKEFYLGDKLYDIVKTREENGTTTYYCIADEKENKLLKSLARAARSRTDSRKGKKASYPHLSFDCVLDLYKPATLVPFEYKRNTVYAASMLLSSCIEVKGPPPKV